MYQVNNSKFSGPFDLLLKLIEDQKLSITEISLSEVTEAYLAHLETIEEREAEALADFLVVATRLLILKSREIFPQEEQEEEVDDLEKQLKIYKEFLEASKKVGEMLRAEKFLFSRAKPPQDLTVEFAPSANLTIEGLKSLFLAVLKRLDPLVKMPRQLMERTVSLQQRILHLKDLMAHHSKMKFEDIFAQAESKTEVIMSFLAMLELVKQRYVRVKQSSLFEDIHIEKI